MRSPHLHDTLRRFCLGAFAVFTRDLEDGRELPFAFEEHGSYGRPTLYEYRPLVGGFDWDDIAFARAYEELEGSLYGEGHSYGAVAPLVGLSVGTQIELGDGIRVRVAATGEVAAMWPEAAGLLPRNFGREPDRICVLEVERSLPGGAAEAPDAPGELADAVTAIRLATAAPVAAGPVIFERLDWRPYGIRPVLPIAATAPPGEPTRLDPFRASVASDVRLRLGDADDDARLGDALDRWELSLFQSEPFRGEQLRHALESALGEEDGAWAAAMRGAALLGATPQERADLAEKLRQPSCELLHEDRRGLGGELDETRLGSPARASLQQRAS